MTFDPGGGAMTFGQGGGVVTFDPGQRGGAVTFDPGWGRWLTFDATHLPPP